MPKAFCAYSLAKKAAASHEVEDYMRAEEALSVRKLKISSIFLFKAPNENAKAFCAYSLAKKTVPRKAVEFVLLPLATKRNSQFVASENASIFGEKEQTSDSVSMFASANKRQERSLRRCRGLTSFFRA